MLCSLYGGVAMGISGVVDAVPAAAKVAAAPHASPPPPLYPPYCSAPCSGSLTTDWSARLLSAVLDLKPSTGVAAPLLQSLCMRKVQERIRHFKPGARTKHRRTDLEESNGLADREKNSMESN